MEEWWNENNKDFLKHVPWNKSGEDPDADGDLPESRERTPAFGGTAAGSVDRPRVIVVNTKEVAPREFHIKKKHTDTPRAVQVAEPCSKVVPGRRTRRSAE